MFGPLSFLSPMPRSLAAAPIRSPPSVASSSPRFSGRRPSPASFSPLPHANDPNCAAAATGSRDASPCLGEFIVNRQPDPPTSVDGDVWWPSSVRRRRLCTRARLHEPGQPPSKPATLIQAWALDPRLRCRSTCGRPESRRWQPRSGPAASIYAQDASIRGSFDLRPSILDVVDSSSPPPSTLLVFSTNGP